MEPWSTYVVEEEKKDLGRISGTIDTILPVSGDTAIVAGESTRVSSGLVSTALVDTRTIRVAGSVATEPMMKS